MRDGSLSFCLPVEPPARGGGGFRFLRNFEAFLDRRAIPWTRRLGAGARVLFVNAWHTGWESIIAAAWTNPSVTVVHRVDGAAADYGRDPAVDRVQSRVNRLADLTIFQSEYCRYSTREKFLVIAHDGPAIHNPVDVKLFSPEGERAALPPFDGPRLCAVTWSTNPRKGAASLYRLSQALPQVQFVLCGRFDNAPARANVARTGVLEAAGVAGVLRACDVLATFSQNEACPNVVLEALATGLPVLYLDSGATKELASDCGVAVTEETFAGALASVLADRAALSRRARARALERFSPDDVFARYLAHIGEALRPRGASRLARLRELATRLLGRAS